MATNLVEGPPVEREPDQLRYLNREISALDYYARVLALAEEDDVASRYPDRAAHMRSFLNLDGPASDAKNTGGDEPSRAEQEEIERRLSELGYI